MTDIITIPEVSQLADGYEVIWKDSGIKFDFTHLADKADGVAVELRVTKAGGHLYQAKAGLLSISSKQTWARELKSRLNNTSWPQLIEQAFKKVLDLYREGDPISEVLTSDSVSRPAFLLEPILYRGLPTIIFGEKGVAKSTMALVIYTCLTLPWLDNPLGWQVPEKPVKTLLIDWEVDLPISQFYLKCIQQGAGLPAFPLYYRRGMRPLAGDLEQIKRQVQERDIKAIIIDSLGPAVGGDLMKPAEALAFTQAVKQINCTTLIIGQTSKDRESKKKSVFGSTYFEYYSRNIFELRKSQEEGEEEMDVALFQTYCNLSRKQPAQGFHLTFDTDHEKIMIERQPITLPELVERMTVAARILSALKSEPMTTKEIMAELKSTRAITDMNLSRLRKAQKITKVDDKWGLLKI
jgi:hypothetical protein